MVSAFVENKDIIEYLFTKAPKYYRWAYNEIAEEAVRGGNKDILEYIFPKAPNDYEWDYSRIERIADLRRNKEITDLIQRWKDKKT